MEKQNAKSLAYIAVCAVAVFLSFFLHEFSHWLMGEALGYKMALTLNSAYPLNYFYLKSWHQMAISAAGPVFTIIQAMSFYCIIDRSRKASLFPFVFIPLYMRLLGGVLNLFNLNDEGRISRDLGVGTYTLSVAVCLLLFYLVYRISINQKYTLKFNMVTLFWTIIFSSILILSDMYLILRII